MAYLTDDLLAAVKRDSFMPTTQGSFSDAQLLAIGDELTLNTICPLLVSMDENWYLEPVDGAFVANQADYTLPEYAMWLKLKHVDRINAGQYLRITRIDIPDLTVYNTTQTGTPSAFYLKNDTITFFQTPAAGITDTYRLHIYRRPNRMVPIASAAQILSVNKVTGVVTYTAAPPGTYTASSFHDFFKGLPPFRRIITNSQATAQAGATQTFPIADVQDLATGDWINVHNETVFPAMPLELDDCLKELIIASLNRTQSDYESYSVQEQRIVERIKTIMKAPGARIVGQGKKISFRQNGLIGQLYNRGYRY